MNNKNISHEDTKTRRVENIRHTRASGYPDSRQRFVQQLVGQLDRRHPAFVPQAVAQIIDAVKVQQSVALLSAIQIGRGL